MRELTPEQEAWIATRPPHVAAVMRERPPLTCYRSTENGGHYWIVAYDEHKDGKTVTLTVAHGSDSFLPGASVFGVEPGTLRECDCGSWEPPTGEQKEALGALIVIERAYRKGVH